MHIVCACVSLVTTSSLANADEDPNRAPRASLDTTRGRLDGDVTLGAGLGATFGPRNPRAAVDLRARYLSTSGIFLTYEDSLGISGAEPLRLWAFGAELRPLFLARWLTGNEFGQSRLDLFVDSFSLELGGFTAQPSGGNFFDTLGLQAGIGLEIPLFSSATGLFIGMHGGCRWSEAALSGQTISGPDDRALFGTLTLSWHQVLGVHLVDLGDEAPR